jgi:hypothetical protein
VEQLKSPYLRDILAKGKKFRLEQLLSSVLPRLQGLREYVDYKIRKAEGDAKVAGALKAWMEAIWGRARAALSSAAATRRPLPDGFPGLRDQLNAAKNALVFGPEDRAPHAVFFACGRSYAGKLHSRLNEGDAFIRETRPHAEVFAALEAFNEDLGTKHIARMPYLYGSWKAKKAAFRWIAGTSRKVGDLAAVAAAQPIAGEGDNKEEGPPMNALTEAAGILVKVCSISWPPSGKRIKLAWQVAVPQNTGSRRT